MEAELGWPVFVKPVNLGSSVGVSRACDAEELAAAMEEALRYDCKVLVEEAITGAEVECAVMGNHHNAIPSDVIGEIVPLREMYDYEGKYLDGSTQLYIPARIPEAQTELMPSGGKGLPRAGLPRPFPCRLLCPAGWHHSSE